MLVDARPPASQIPMIYFFATPTAGADVTDIASHLSQNPQLVDMLPLDYGGYVKDLFEQWLQTSGDPRLNYPNAIASYCAAERLKTWGVLIVPEYSAVELCNRETEVVLTNHIGIVKPENVRADSYVYFKAAYQRTFGNTADAINYTIESVNATNHAAPAGQFDEYTVKTRENHDLNLLLRQANATSKYIDVGCGETRQGDVVTQIGLKPTERVIEVRPAIANSVNIKSSWAAVVSNADGKAVIRYSIQGLDRQLFNCPGGGHADVVVTYVVERAPDASPLKR